MSLYEAIQKHQKQQILDRYRIYDEILERDVRLVRDIEDLNSFRRAVERDSRLLLKAYKEPTEVPFDGYFKALAEVDVRFGVNRNVLNDSVLIQHTIEYLRSLFEIDQSLAQVEDQNVTFDEGIKAAFGSRGVYAYMIRQGDDAIVNRARRLEELGLLDNWEKVQEVRDGVRNETLDSLFP